MQTPEQRPRRGLAAVRFAALTVLVAALAVITFWTGPDREALVGAMRERHFSEPAVAVFGAALLTTVLVPRTLLSLVGGLLFGWLSGAMYVLVGVTIGAIIAFTIGRMLGRDFVAQKLRGRLAQIEQAVSGRGMLSVAITRLIPLVPFCVSNYVFGTTSVRLAPFVAGTLLGAAPATLAYAALGSATAQRDAAAMTAATVVVVILGTCGSIGTYLVWRRRPRKPAAV